MFREELDREIWFVQCEEVLSSRAGFEVVNDGMVRFGCRKLMPNLTRLQLPITKCSKSRPLSTLNSDRGSIGLSLFKLHYPTVLLTTLFTYFVLLFTFFKQSITFRKSVSTARLTSSGIRSNLLF